MEEYLLIYINRKTVIKILNKHNVNAIQTKREQSYEFFLS